MAGPKPAALPLGDAPMGYLTIIEYQSEMSRLFFHVKRVIFLKRLLFLLVNWLRRVNKFVLRFLFVVFTIADLPDDITNDEC